MTITNTPPAPPTMGMPEYADYPVRYAVDGRAHPLTHASTYVEALAQVAEFQDSRGVREPRIIEAEHVAPDLTAVVTVPWSGGTWTGLCGSTRWVVDLDGAHRRAQQVLCALADEPLRPWQSSTARERIATMQSWWVREFPKAADQGGFRVECQQENRHDGSCRVERWVWDGRAGCPLPDLT